MAQQIPVLITIILSALAIMGVVLWRLRPQGDNSELSAKLTETEKRLLDAERMAASKSAEAQQLTYRVQNADAKVAVVEQRVETLSTDLREAESRAARYEQVAEDWQQRYGTVASERDTAQVELETTRRQLSSALAKQEADDTAARRFEGLGQKVLNEALEKAAKTFKEGSGEELGRHAEAVAKTLEPLQQKLEAYDKAVEELKKNSSEAYGGLTKQLELLSDAERSLHDQAQALTTALSSKPKMRGMFGEITLRRIVEFAGMLPHCHFEEQLGKDTDQGRKIPDLAIDMPEGQRLIVDAKAVMDAYVRALETTDDVERAALIKQHCQNVRARIVDLASKDYAAEFGAVDAIILFLPGDSLYLAALEHDVDLMEFAIKYRVTLSCPSQLLYMLHNARHVWRRVQVAEEAELIKDLARQIYKSGRDFTVKYGAIGKRIESLIGAFNDGAATLDTTLMRAGQKMNALGSMSDTDEMPDVLTIVEGPRVLKSREARAAIASVDGPLALLELAAADVVEGGAR